MQVKYEWWKYKDSKKSRKSMVDKVVEVEVQS